MLLGCLLIFIGGSAMSIWPEPPDVRFHLRNIAPHMETVGILIVIFGFLFEFIGLLLRFVS